MGNIHIVYPYDEHVSEWFGTQSIRTPIEFSVGRNPTSQEIFGVLDSLYGFEYEIDGQDESDISITLSRKRGEEWANLQIAKNDRGCSLSFRKGTEEVIELIVGELSLICGDLMIWPDTGELPIAMSGGKKYQFD